MRVTASVFCSSIRPEQRDFAESFATEVIPLRSGHNLRRIRRAGSYALSKQNQKRRTGVSDPHGTSRGRGRPRHISRALLHFVHLRGLVSSRFGGVSTKFWAANTRAYPSWES